MAVPARRGPKPRPAVERVLARCVREDRGYRTPCLIFQGGLDHGGYGKVSDDEHRTRGAHTVVWEHRHGPLPPKHDPDHLCRQHDCCEETHLELVTHRENLLRGDGPRLTRERARARTSCKRGHELTPENTYHFTKLGYPCRGCKRCRREAALRHYHSRTAVAMLAVQLRPEEHG